MELKCPRCEHQWDYRGKKEYPARVSCPNCLSRVAIPKNPKQDE